MIAKMGAFLPDAGDVYNFKQNNSKDTVFKA